MVTDFQIIEAARAMYSFNKTQNPKVVGRSKHYAVVSTTKRTYISAAEKNLDAIEARVFFMRLPDLTLSYPLAPMSHWPAKGPSRFAQAAVIAERLDNGEEWKKIISSLKRRAPAPVVPEAPAPAPQPEIPTTSVQPVVAAPPADKLPAEAYDPNSRFKPDSHPHRAVGHIAPPVIRRPQASRAKTPMEQLPLDEKYELLLGKVGKFLREIESDEMDALDSDTEKAIEELDELYNQLNHCSYCKGRGFTFSIEQYEVKDDPVQFCVRCKRFENHTQALRAAVEYIDNLIPNPTNIANPPAV